MVEMVPWYNGFRGTIEKKGSNSFISRGIIEKVDNSTLVVRELPVFRWVEDYKEFLESMMKGPGSFVKSFTMQHVDQNSVEFTIKLGKDKMPIAESIGLYTKFKLESTISMNSMHLFDVNGKLKRYHTPLEIIEDFFPIRMEFYHKRKDFLVDKLEKEVNRLNNRARFCNAIISGELKINNRSKSDIIADLEKMQFDKYDGSFDYLLNTSLWNLTKERITQLMQEREKKEGELKKLRDTEPSSMWLEELEDCKAEISKVLTPPKEPRSVPSPAIKESKRSSRKKEVPPPDPALESYLFVD